MASSQKELELRCFCNRHPLLAVAGRDSNGRGYVHIKTWKGQRIYAEVVILSGAAMVRCRECYRWHRFRIVKSDVESLQTNLPESINV